MIWLLKIIYLNIPYRALEYMHGLLSRKESFFFLVVFTVNGLIFLLKNRHTNLM